MRQCGSGAMKIFTASLPHCPIASFLNVPMQHHHVAAREAGILEFDAALHQVAA